MRDTGSRASRRAARRAISHRLPRGSSTRSDCDDAAARGRDQGVRDQEPRISLRLVDAAAAKRLGQRLAGFAQR